MTLTTEFPSPTAALPDAEPPAWTRICPLSELIPGRGVAALLNPGAEPIEPQLQVAVFLTAAGELYAVGNRDPFTGAAVIAHGLTGRRDGSPTVASPMLKHVFDLLTGECVDGPAGPQPLALPVYPVRCNGGSVFVSTIELPRTGE